jgi:hypothetical protein
MLVQKGIAIEDSNNDDDIYAMLVPGESETLNSNGGSGGGGAGGVKGKKGENKKPKNIRSPFEENFPYDNIYQIQHVQEVANTPEMAQLNFSLTCQACCADFVIAPHL